MKPVIFPRARGGRVLRYARLLFKNPALAGSLFKFASVLKTVDDATDNAMPAEQTLF